jgi:hypothetical protein
MRDLLRAIVLGFRRGAIETLFEQCHRPGGAAPGRAAIFGIQVYAVYAVYAGAGLFRFLDIPSILFELPSWLWP